MDFYETMSAARKAAEEKMAELMAARHKPDAEEFELGKAHEALEAADEACFNALNTLSSYLHDARASAEMERWMERKRGEREASERKREERRLEVEAKRQERMNQLEGAGAS